MYASGSHLFLPSSKQCEMVAYTISNLPLTTTNGFNYILILVMEHYTQLILMISRTQDAYTAAFTALYSFYKSKGKRLKYQCLDNEVSTSVNELFADPKLT